MALFCENLDSIIDVTFFTRQTTSTMKDAPPWACIYSHNHDCVCNMKQSARNLLGSSGSASFLIYEIVIFHGNTFKLPLH